jgi:hypothetical protein
MHISLAPSPAVAGHRMRFWLPGKSSKKQQKRKSARAEYFGQKKKSCRQRNMIQESVGKLVNLKERLEEKEGKIQREQLSRKARYLE